MLNEEEIGFQQFIRHNSYNMLDHMNEEMGFRVQRHHFNVAVEAGAVISFLWLRCKMVVSDKMKDELLEIAEKNNQKHMLFEINNHLTIDEAKDEFERFREAQIYDDRD